MVERVRAEHPELWWSVSWATRPPRAGERQGEHYWFRSRDEFEALRDSGGFLEWADVYGVLKGTPSQPLVEALNAGYDGLLEMDIQGVASVLAQFPDAVVFFVVAPDRLIQEQRLRARGTDTDAEIEHRLARAADEEAQARALGLRVVVNHDVGEVAAQIAAILEDRRSR